MADNIVRYSSYVDSIVIGVIQFDFATFINEFIRNIQLISLKQLYGWTLYVCIFTFLAFLLYDRPYVRKALRRVPRWKSVGRQFKKTLRVIRVKK